MNRTDFDNASSSSADVVPTTYRHLYNTLIRRDVEEASSRDLGFKTMFVDLKGKIQDAILCLDSSQMDEPVPPEIHERFKDLIMCLQEKTPELKVSVLPE